MKRIILFLSAATALLVLLPTTAHAHTALARANPSPGATLDVPPAALSLEFTERLDPAFSRVQLIDATGTVIAATETVRPEAPSTLALALPTLDRGSYTALGRVRSAEDGHVTEGTVPFGAFLISSSEFLGISNGSIIPILGPIISSLWMAALGVFVLIRRASPSAQVSALVSR